MNIASKLLLTFLFQENIKLMRQKTRLSAMAGLSAFYVLEL